MSNQENEEIVELINNFLTTSINENIFTIIELSNEFKLADIVREIEPTIEENHGIIELSSKESNFIVKYFNLQKILKSLQNFFENHPEKSRVLPSTNFFEKIKIKEIINENNEHLIFLGEALLVLTAFSSKKDEFLDRLSNLDENLQFSFVRILEKYIAMNEDQQENVIFEEDDEIEEKEKFHIEKCKKRYSSESITKRNAWMESSKLKKKTVQIEHELNDFIKSVEIEIVNLTKKLNESENKRFDLQFKLEETFRESLEIKERNESIITMGEKNKIYSKSVELNSLQKQLESKTESMEKFKVQVDLDLKKYINDIEKLNNKVREQNLLIESLNKDHEENFILKEKLNELEILKQIRKEHEKLIIDYQKQCGELNFLKKEIRDSKPIIEMLRKEIIVDRERNKDVMFEKKKLELEKHDLMSSLKRFENNKSRKSALEPKSISNFHLKTPSDFQIDNLIKINDFVERILELENLNQSLKIEKMETLNKNEEWLERVDKLLQQNNVLLQENDEMYKKNENLKFNIQDLDYEIIKLQKEVNETKLENENLNYELQKIINENEKLEKQCNEEVIRNFDSQLKIFTIEKEILIKELESEKCKSSNNKKFIENLENENKQILSKNQELELELQNKIIQLDFSNNKVKKISLINYKSIASKKSSANSPEKVKNDEEKMKLEIQFLKKENEDLQGLKIIINNLRTELLELSSLKNECQNLRNENSALKQIINQKQEIIKRLDQDQKLMEANIKSINLKTEGILEIYKQKLLKKNKEIIFLKESYNEQKSKIELEHGMLSNCLFEMSMQFITLRNEIQKKIE